LYRRDRVRRLSQALLVGIAFWCSSGSARADYITAKLLELQPDDPYLLFSYKLDDGPKITVAAGQQVYQRLSGPPVVPTVFSTFCVELNQSVQLNQNYTFEIRAVADVPRPGTGVPEAPGMGIVKADLISELWGRHYTDVNDDVSRAAFQIAIWEIVFEDLSSSNPYASLDLYSTNGFRAYGNTNPVMQGAIALADSWLNDLNGSGPRETQLIGLSSNGAQDQITVATPAPPSVLLLLTGIPLFIGRAWQLRRRAAAAAV
jgi:hypothetical protein